MYLIIDVCTYYNLDNYQHMDIIKIKFVFYCVTVMTVVYHN